MPTCPSGHESASGDFCDTCGMRIDGSAPAPAGSLAAPAAAEPAGAVCPQCGTARSGQFCEACGFDFDSGKVPRAGPVPSSGPAGWTALVTADRAYYDQVIAVGDPDAAPVTFPDYCPERRFSLTAPEMRIGRHSASRGLQPEIDLTGPPTDPGVSRLHAVLIAEPDGSWIVIDPGSENGTFVNDQEIAAGVRVPLRHGDRIHLGAWTVVTIQAP